MFEQFLRSHGVRRLVLAAFRVWHVICKALAVKHPVSLKDAWVASNLKPQQDKLV
jgi:hypothetical protein